MGKSPGQWIKTLLSGKKSARFHAGKGRDPSVCLQNPDNDKEYNAGEGAPVAAVSAPVISDPILVSTNHIGVNPTLEEAAPSNLGGKATSLRSIYQDGNNQGVTRYVASNDPNNFREEHAAIKAQAAFRGYLARKAFHALKGIIRLQALCRRHLVRRQAVATLYAMEGIVRLQAIVRGQVVRHSTGHEISTMFGQAKTVDAGAWKLKFSTNTFVSKLLSPSLLAKPLQINYDQEDSNSVCSWLGRWTTTSFWKPHYHAKKVTDSKAQSRRGNYAMETESARSKRTLRRNLAVNTDFSQTNVTSEPEKKKYNLRKITSSPAESVQDPKSDLQKVKRNLRKLSNPIAEASDQLVTETEKPKRSMRNVASAPSEIPFQGIEESIEQKGDDVALTPEIKLETEIASKSLVAEGPVEVSAGDLTSNELELLQQIDNEVNTSLLKEELGSKEEVCNESQKTSKRRFSFSEKSEHAENGLPKTTALPGYMGATESAKAKLRGLTSPRSMSDSVEQNGYTRRHSLSSSTNGKLSSHSPCTQRLAQPSGRSGIRSQKSLFSSRDSNERAIQVEWRR